MFTHLNFQRAFIIIDDYVYTLDDEVFEGEIEGRKKFRVQQFMGLMNQNQKTLVFCATQKYAAAIRNLINQCADSSSPSYCHRVTADDGAPIAAEQFIKNLFGDIPYFFSNEDELREIWSLPDTRKRLLHALADKGYAQAQFDELKRLIHAEDSDLYDMLAYVAYHSVMRSRLKRAKVHFINYNQAQREFLNFVLKQYVQAGMGALDDAKLPDLLVIKYQALADAKRQLGDTKSIREVFINFQSHLYAKEAA